MACTPWSMQRDEARAAVAGHSLPMYRPAASTMGVAPAVAEAGRAHSRVRLRPIRMCAEAASLTDDAMRWFSTLTTADTSTMAIRESARTDVATRAVSLRLEVGLGKAKRTIREAIGRRIGMLHHQVHEVRSEARYCESPVNLWAAVTRAIVAGPLRCTFS